MTASLALHSLTTEGRASVLDNDLDALAREHPALVQVFEEVQFLRQEVLGLLDQLDGTQDELRRLQDMLEE